MINLSDLIGFAGVAAVIAAVEFLKLVWPELPKRFHPLFALGFALVLNVAITVYQQGEVFPAILGGLLVGFAASGVYSQVKAVAKNE